MEAFKFFGDSCLATALGNTTSGFWDSAEECINLFKHRTTSDASC